MPTRKEARHILLQVDSCRTAVVQTGAVQTCVLYSCPSRQNHLALPQQICSLSEYYSVVSSNISIPNVGIHCYNVFCQVLFIITLIAQLDLCTPLLNQVASAFAGGNCLSPQSSATSSPLTSRVGPTLCQNCKRDFHPNLQHAPTCNTDYIMYPDSILPIDLLPAQNAIIPRSSIPWSPCCRRSSAIFLHKTPSFSYDRLTSPSPRHELHSPSLAVLNSYRNVSGCNVMKLRIWQEFVHSNEATSKQRLML